MKKTKSILVVVVVVIVVVISGLIYFLHNQSININSIQKNNINTIQKSKVNKQIIYPNDILFKLSGNSANNMIQLKDQVDNWISTNQFNYSEFNKKNEVIFTKEELKNMPISEVYYMFVDLNGVEAYRKGVTNGITAAEINKTVQGIKKNTNDGKDFA